MNLNYGQAHDLIIRTLGKASDYPCAECGDTSSRHHWAYQYTAGRAEQKDPKGRRYSTNPQRDYLPMCSRCHMKFDAMNEERIREAFSASGKRLAERNARRRETDPSYGEWLNERGNALATEINRRRENDPDYRERLRQIRSGIGTTASERLKGMYRNDPTSKERRVSANARNMSKLQKMKETDPVFASMVREKETENGRRQARLLASMRVRCSPCGMESSPAGIGVHQKASGHSGKERIQ